MSALFGLDENDLWEGAVGVLAVLARREPLLRSEFAEASGLGPKRAKLLRDTLLVKGLVLVRDVPQGERSTLGVFLTERGRELAARVRQTDDLLRQRRPDDAAD